MHSPSLWCILVVGFIIHDAEAQIPTNNIADAIISASRNQAAKRDRNRQLYEDGTDRSFSGRSEDLLQRFHGRRSKSQEISNIANHVFDTTQHLLDRGFSIADVTSDPTATLVQETLMLRGVCPLPTTYKCDPLSPYRTIDGSCNNIKNPEWGKSNVAQKRVIGPAYEPGTVGGPRATGITGKPLPNPRTISNVVHINRNGFTTNLNITLHTFQMGQFLDHDVIRTPTETGTDGSTISCCQPIDRPECIPIRIPPGDPHFPDGTCMSVVRSAAANPGCTPGFRQQQNEITSYIDGSNVYGSTVDELQSLRNGEYMKTSLGNNLPSNLNVGCVLNHAGEFCHHAGDTRVNVVPSLTSYHTLFVNEHNRIVNALKAVNPGWTVEKLFQEARKVNIAQIQHIVYNGYLKSFINKDVMATYNLASLRTGYSTSYDNTRDATISNDFGIAYRMGHTWIPNYIDLYSDLNTRQTGSEMGPFDLVQTYNNPHLIFLNGRTGSQGLQKWLTSDPCPSTDRVIEDSARNRLFEDSTGASFDLAALNINRGRDHGVPPYGDYRINCGLSPLTASWDSLVDQNPTSVKLLSQVYDDPRDIDLFTGVITERWVNGSQIGPTLSCILGREFQKLKEGDSYWYERPEPQGFPSVQLDEIRKTSLSAIICANIGLTQIQRDAFRMPDVNNPVIPCTSVPSIDFTQWKSTASPQTRGVDGLKINAKLVDEIEKALENGI